MLHSGSRNIGKTIGETAISMAREIAERKERKLRDRDLAWLDEGSAEFDMYVEGLRWAQDYAAHNRALMLHAVLNALHEEFGREIATFENAVQCHHNYASVEEHFGQQVWVTRKGAVSARRGELGIIPGSMGAKSFIVRGKGNADSYCSCSHGAGRRMSRGAAKRTYTLADLKGQTAGVECRKDEGVLDEIPGAYKSIDAVMAAQAELVDVVAYLEASDVHQGLMSLSRAACRTFCSHSAPVANCWRRSQNRDGGGWIPSPHVLFPFSPFLAEWHTRCAQNAVSSRHPGSSPGEGTNSRGRGEKGRRGP